MLVSRGLFFLKRLYSVVTSLTKHLPLDHLHRAACDRVRTRCKPALQSHSVSIMSSWSYCNWNRPFQLVAECSETEEKSRGWVNRFRMHIWQVEPMNASGLDNTSFDSVIEQSSIQVLLITIRAALHQLLSSKKRGGVGFFSIIWIMPAIKKLSFLFYFFYMTIKYTHTHIEWAKRGGAMTLLLLWGSLIIMRLCVCYIFKWI